MHMFGNMKKTLAMLLMLAMLVCSVPVLADEAVTAAYCAHSWAGGEVIQKPSCTSEGLYKKVCTLCGADGSGYVIQPKLSHSYTVVLSYILEPTCASNGWGVYACSVCGAVESSSRAIPALGHNYGEAVWLPATCTEDSRKVQTCARCNETVLLAKDLNSALGHDIREVITTPATCTTPGLAQTKCSRCDAIPAVDTVIPVTSHDYKAYTIPATCSSTGLSGKKCSICGAEEGTPVVTPKLSHVMTVLPPKDATCTTPGLTIGEYCSVCGEIFQPQEVIPASHEYTILLPKDPSCTATGLTIGEYCSVCGEIFQPQTVVPALGHKAVAIPGKAASCTATGLTEGSKCSVCSAVITAQQTIPVIEHSYKLSSNGKNYICSFCGDSLSAKPKDITINTKSSIEVDMGDTLTLDVIYSPADSFSPVAWSSSNKKVVTIDEDGVIEALKEGSATITAKTKNGRKDSIKIKVVDPYKPTKVELDQEGTIILGLGEELQLNAILYPDTAETELEWDVNSSRCKVDEDGLVTTVRTGSATITVKTANGKRDSVSIRVVDPDEPYSVELSESGTIKLTVGEEFQLDAVVYPATADYELSWSSSSSRCEVDDDGLITAVREGSATITVRTQNGEKDTVKVRISD